MMTDEQDSTPFTAGLKALGDKAEQGNCIKQGGPADGAAPSGNPALEAPTPQRRPVAKQQTEDIIAMEKAVFTFVTNLTAECQHDKVQLMFQVEHAWWFYEDVLRKENPSLPHFNSYGTFTHGLVARLDLVRRLLPDPQAALKEYAAFKLRIPVYGAILMDQHMERVLLVRGHASTAGWGFPKGKINHGESEVECACREVLEETGYNIEALIKPDEFIEAKGQNDKLHKLFIVVGLDPETCAFAPQLAGEIGAYGWHWLHELPVTREDADKAYIASGGKQHRFYFVQPFIGRLRSWVSRKRRKLNLGPPPWEQLAADEHCIKQALRGPSQPQLLQQAGVAPANCKGTRDLRNQQPSKHVRQAFPQAVADVAGAHCAPGMAAQPPCAAEELTAAAAAVASALPQQGKAPVGVNHNASSTSAVAVLLSSYPAPNLVLSNAFTFDMEAILRSLAG